MAISPALRVGWGCVCVCVALGCSLGWITSSSKEALHLRGDRPLPTTNARATCLEPERKQIVTEDSSLWGTSIGLAGG